MCVFYHNKKKNREEKKSESLLMIKVALRWYLNWPLDYPKNVGRKRGRLCVHSRGAPRSVSAASSFPGPENPGDPGTSQLLGQA